MKLSSILAATGLLTWLLAAEAVEKYSILAKVQQGPGNITVTGDGRVIMSQHQFYQPGYSVVELKGNGEITPFPNLALNDGSGLDGLKLDSVLGIRADNKGVVWMLDNGMRNGVTPKLVGWDTKLNQLHRVFPLPPPIAPKDEFLNDFAVDCRHKAIFISDPAGGGNAAIIVVNLATGLARRVLEGDASVVPEQLDLIIDGAPVQIKDANGKYFRPRIGVNPITEDLENEWVYFGPMHGLSLYRIKAADLLDEQLDRQALAQKVERYSSKPISDGISIDRDNNIYLGDLAENAIGVITADRKYRKLAQNPELAWVDSFSFGPEGKLYAIVNKLHRSAVLNGGVSASKPPYYVLRIDALAPGQSGR